MIVEDHVVLAEGLELMLSRHADLAVVGTANTAAEARRIAEGARPDVVLLDFRLPDASGATLSTALRAQLPNVAIVILTAHADEETLLQAVSAGACGFLSKAQPSGRIIEAIHRAADGEMLIPAATLAGMISRLRSQALEHAERERIIGLLTEREREVLTLMARGLDNRAIAESLVVSVNTVRTHVQHVLEKLGTHSKLEAIARASQLGLLDR